MAQPGFDDFSSGYYARTSKLTKKAIWKTSHTICVKFYYKRVCKNKLAHHKRQCQSMCKHDHFIVSSRFAITCQEEFAPASSLKWNAFFANAASEKTLQLPTKTK